MEIDIDPNEMPKNYRGPHMDAELQRVQGEENERLQRIKERFGIMYETESSKSFRGHEVFLVTSQNKIECVINSKKFSITIDKISLSDEKVHVLGFCDESGKNFGLPKSFPRLRGESDPSGWISFVTLASWIDFRQ